MLNKPSFIAIEEHWTTTELTAALKRLPEGRRDESLALNEMGDKLAKLEDIGDARIAAMDEQGIDMHIISLAPPATGPLSPAEAVALSRETNDIAAEAVRRHPSRLRAMSTLPMAEPTAVAAELERSAGIGFVGAMVYGRTGETPLDDPCYDDLFAAAAALGQPIFIHPQIPSNTIRQAHYSGLGTMTDLALSTFSWGWHLEAAIAVLRLIARGIFDRHLDLKIILGHWGELLLFWQDRTDSLSRIANLERKVSDYTRSNIFITSSGMFNPALLQHALAATAIDQLLFSTDYPFQSPDPNQLQRFLTGFANDEDRNKFCHGNARRLFGIGN
ncbi:amidohydrolase family protein [Paenibacillus brasilensis]|uniref:TIM-barrel fold metal-dependent hydrolase n=1 Tax=Paenibacillus brasilensis TaxID=128574 RepID=A0ABU0L761_9BACL|nr:amidohydrolase family protein [Paenibacillus brasilensis]MDQ0497111.1 putative TIM-barrel fold metal-dependent hydrolase [Paenibacillus brasilensis]